MVIPISDDYSKAIEQNPNKSYSNWFTCRRVCCPTTACTTGDGYNRIDHTNTLKSLKIVSIKMRKMPNL
jgi:hypothetical protein